MRAFRLQRRKAGAREFAVAALTRATIVNNCNSPLSSRMRRPDIREPLNSLPISARPDGLLERIVLDILNEGEVERISGMIQPAGLDCDML